jgi:hypothetical protein
MSIWVFPSPHSSNLHSPEIGCWNEYTSQKCECWTHISSGLGWDQNVIQVLYQYLFKPLSLLSDWHSPWGKHTELGTTLAMSLHEGAHSLGPWVGVTGEQPGHMDRGLTCTISPWRVTKRLQLCRLEIQDLWLVLPWDIFLFYSKFNSNLSLLSGQATDPVL